MVVASRNYTFMTEWRRRSATPRRARFRSLGAALRTQCTSIPIAEKLSAWLEHKLNVNVQAIRQFGRNRWQRLGPPNGIDRFLVQHGLT